MANITTSKITNNSMTVYLEKLDTRYNQSQRTCKWYVMEEKLDAAFVFLGSMTLDNKISYSRTYEITGLSPGTSYVVRAEINASGWSKPVVLTNTFKTTGGSSTGPDDPDPDKPVDPEPPPGGEGQNFYWSDQAREAFNNHGRTTELKAEEWNTFMQEIKKEFKKWDVNSVIFKPGDPITAEAFNHVVGIIGNLYVKQVDPGQPCEGKKFIDLEYAWNKWIDS